MDRKNEPPTGAGFPASDRGHSAFTSRYGERTFMSTCTPVREHNFQGTVRFPNGRPQGSEKAF